MPSSEVFGKWKAGDLHSGSKEGPTVKSHKQATAIYLSEKRKEAEHGGKYPEKKGYAKGGRVKRYDDGGSVGDAIGTIVDKIKSNVSSSAGKPYTPPAMPKMGLESSGVKEGPTDIPMIGQAKGGPVKSTWRKYGW